MLNDLVEQFGIVPHCIDGMRARSRLLCHLCHLCAIYAIYGAIYGVVRTGCVRGSENPVHPRSRSEALARVRDCDGELFVGPGALWAAAVILDRVGSPETILER